MNWYILQVTASRETQVLSALTRLGFEVFKPLEPRVKYISRHTNRRVVTYIPLIPRALFVRDNGADIEDLLRIRNVRGIARNAQDEPWQATNREIVQFKAMIELWSQEIIHGKKSEEVIPKWVNLHDIKAMGMVFKTKFGIEGDML